MRQPSLFIMRGPKRSIIVLAALFISSVVVMLVLYTGYVIDVKPSGGFVRNVEANVFTDSIILALPFNSYYLAGNAGGKIYLGNETAPLHLLSVTERKLFSAQIGAPNPKPNVSHIVVDSPFFYLEDLERFTIRAGSIASFNVEYPAVQSAFFSEAIPLSPNSVVQRTISDEAKEYALSKLTLLSHTYQHNLLQKQVDGLFCTDGMLNYDKAKNNFIYVYFYRNEFICTDTSLNLQFRNNTVDTISRARIDVANLTTEDARILSTPPFVVNRRSTAFSNRLFINSSINSDSESTDVMKHNSVIDVYDLENKGAYLYSFYLPHFQGHQMKYFAVYGDYLFSIHDRFLIRYRLKRIG